MRKDNKSQYQLKKEKLQKIKIIIDNNNLAWASVKAAKTEEDKIYWSTKVKMANEIVKEIWEIVKDEKNNY